MLISFRFYICDDFIKLNSGRVVKKAREDETQWYNYI